MIETPPELLAALRVELSHVRAPLPRQIEALSELFRLFTSERRSLGRLSYLDVPRLRAAYLRYHLPLNTARAMAVLKDLLRVAPRVADVSDVVVDIGAGLGSASLATLLGLPPLARRRFALYDRSAAALRVARRLIARCRPGRGGPRWGPERPEIFTRAWRWPGLPPMPRQGLVWLSMVLNELGAGASRGVDPARLLEELASKLRDRGIVVIMEPAMRAPGIALLKLHDAALASKDWRVLAPCTHQLGCPLLRERDRSWCHFRFRWQAPQLVRDVADPLELEHEEPSFAYLALERIPWTPGHASPAAPAGLDETRARVIGDAMDVRGGTGIYLCADGKRRLAAPPPPEAARGDVVDGRRLVARWDAPA
ncbi:MAG: hypothetical protein HY721_11510 [Planctomycetes bacterium]|nr:hypothetical protein [Planctomycetota bacterium]